MSQTESKEIAPINNNEVLALVKQDFTSVSVDQKITWQKELNFATQLLSKNKYLDDIAWSNAQSLKNAIINVSAFGSV